MINRRQFCSVFVGAFVLKSSLLARSDSELFREGVYKNTRGERMLYRLFVPRRYNKSRQYPLVLWLHGGAGRGQDNLKQISGGNTSGSHVWTMPGNQAVHPCFVFAPQCAENGNWTTDEPVKSGRPLQLALEALAELQTKFSIDAARLYVTGQSMGGFGTWAVICEHPDLFAAAIPVCGGGDATQASKLSRLPVWAFHGEKDEAVSVERSRSMIAAMREAGGTPKYTEYKGAGHVIWNDVFKEPALISWVFTQRRAAA